MGIWTWYARCEPEGFDPERCVGTPGAVEEIDTHRLWHALHVALAGVEQGGEPPASYIVWTTREPELEGYTDARFVHPPALVQSLSRWLEGVDFDAAVDKLLVLAQGELCVYSYTTADEVRELVGSGSLHALFAEVRRFYADAAAAGQLVQVQRG